MGDSGENRENLEKQTTKNTAKQMDVRNVCMDRQTGTDLLLAQLGGVNLGQIPNYCRRQFPVLLVS